jgi:hypothetical protein
MDAMVAVRRSSPRSSLTSIGVELFKQPGVINGFDVSRFVPIE